MRKLVSLAAMGGALFLIVSCASTPPQKPAPEPAQPTQPQAAVVPAPEAQLAQAKDLKQKVDAYNLGDYAPDDYAAANKDLQDGQDTYGKDNAASTKSLTSAIAEYNSVLTKGGQAFLTKSQAAADDSKKKADDLKASVAVKDDYSKANDVYQQALKEKAAGDIVNASKDFDNARQQFDAVAQTAQQKKDTAMQAMQSAQADESTSQQKATDAEKALKDEGITVPAAGQ
jgi:hypothetical protein